MLFAEPFSQGSKAKKSANIKYYRENSTIRELLPCTRVSSLRTTGSEVSTFVPLPRVEVISE